MMKKIFGNKEVEISGTEGEETMKESKFNKEVLKKAGLAVGGVALGAVGVVAGIMIKQKFGGGDEPTIGGIGLIDELATSMENVTEALEEVTKSE